MIGWLRARQAGTVVLWVLIGTAAVLAAVVVHLIVRVARNKNNGDEALLRIVDEATNRIDEANHRAAVEVVAARAKDEHLQGELRHVVVNPNAAERRWRLAQLAEKVRRESEARP